ncbi:MAG: glycosyltransferase [Magnetococcus sp. MYC-9]
MAENHSSHTFLDTILRLDANPDVTGLVQFVQECGHPVQDLLLAVPELLIQCRMRPAFLLAMFLNNNGYRGPVLSAALSLGGWLFNKEDEEANGLALLQAQADQLAPEQRQLLHDEVLSPLLSQLLAAAFEQQDNGRILKILAIHQALFPRFRTLFDWQAPVPTLSLEEMRRRGRAQARLISCELPPAGTTRQRRRAVVAMRERFYFGNPLSRLSDFGPRIVAAMEGYGWQVSESPFRCSTLDELEEDCRTIVDVCRQQQAELLVMDLNVTIRAPARDEMIVQLRRDNPEIRVVGCMIDAFCFTDEVLIAATAHLDLLWTRDVPSRPLWQRPVMGNKVLNLLFPNAGRLGGTERPLIPEPLFAGGVTAKYVPHRAFWLAATERMGLPLQSRLSTHLEDGLPPLDSFALYMRSLEESTCCLSLSMRYDQSHVATFRGFEVALSGALLVQEATEEMHHYFIPGEHYLEFSSLAELAAVIRFIRENREEAEEVRRNGHRFARQHYNDEKIVGYLDRRLFHPAQA